MVAYPTLLSYKIQFKLKTYIFKDIIKYTPRSQNIFAIFSICQSIFGHMLPIIKIAKADKNYFKADILTSSKQVSDNEYMQMCYHGKALKTGEKCHFFVIKNVILLFII